MDYTTYTLKDFLTDDSFLQWVKHKDEASGAFWHKWIKDHPEKATLIEEAREIIESLNFQQDHIPDQRIVDLQAAIHHRINRTKTYTPVQKELPVYKRYWVAASLLLLVGLAAFLYLKTASFASKELTSGYGETKTYFLPDSSKVTLNSNSKISYTGNWQAGNREVYLEGEAFFEVKKLDTSPTTSNKPPAYRKFIVHTDGIAVEVLGTTFNVLHRHGKTEVVLKTGKVKVTDLSENKAVMMMPGEMVKVEHEDLVKETVDPELYIAWKNNQLILKETTLREIAQLLKDNYDYEVIIQEAALGQKTFVGTFPADDIQVLLQTLTKSINVEVNHKQKRIFFSKKE